jgi:hypothetical protein
MFLMTLVQPAHSGTIFIPNDICTTYNCTSQSSSYTGANAGTGENDYSGVIYKGTPDGSGPVYYDTFDAFGWVCTSTSGSADCSTGSNGALLSGNTGSISSLTMDTVETSSYYAFDDTFTAGASGFSGYVVVFGNLAGLQEGDTYNPGCSTPSSPLLVECNDASGLDNRPAISFVAGNNAWAASHIGYQLEGDTATFIINLNLAPDTSESLGMFVVLDGTGTGPYTPNPLEAYADGSAIQQDPNFNFAGGQVPENFSEAPEPGTIGLVSGCLVAGYFIRRRSLT